MRPVVDQSCYVVLRHLRQLFLEDAFQAGQDDEALSSIVVVDHSKLDFSMSLFYDRGLE